MTVGLTVEIVIDMEKEGENEFKQRRERRTKRRRLRRRMRMKRRRLATSARAEGSWERRDDVEEGGIGQGCSRSGSIRYHPQTWISTDRGPIRYRADPNLIPFDPILFLTKILKTKMYDNQQIVQRH